MKGSHPADNVSRPVTAPDPIFWALRSNRKLHHENENDCSDAKTPVASSSAEDGRLFAIRQLTVSRPDLPYDNPLLKKPLTIEHVKPRLLGHWGTMPRLNFINVHLNRIITQYGLDIIYVTGAGHGGAAHQLNSARKFRPPIKIE